MSTLDNGVALAVKLALGLLALLAVVPLSLVRQKYIQMRRLTVATEKLVNTEKPIIEIALEANYSSQQSFTSAFCLLYEMPPQKYSAIRNATITCRQKKPKHTA